MDLAARLPMGCGARGSIEISEASGAGKGSVERGLSFSSCAFRVRLGPQELIKHEDVRVHPLAKLSRLVRERYRGLTLEQNACAKFLLPSVRHDLL